ncbi:MAG: tetratricopeptide repeat protein, partial [Pirellulales bacterium]
LAGEDTAVILMSDHGYYNDHLRPDPREGRSGPVDWHRPFGIFAGTGPGFTPGCRVYGASIMDIAPTVLHLLGLPAAYDMPGRVLAEVLSGTAPAERIESWEEIPGSCGMYPAEMRVDPAEARAVLDQLVALGYVEAPSDDVQKTVSQTIQCNLVNLAQSLADSYQFAEAIGTLEQLDAELQSAPSTQIMLASCLLGIGDRKRARSILEALLVGKLEHSRVHMMLGALEFAEGNIPAALAHLTKVAAAEPRLPNLHNKLGEVYLAMKRYDDATAAFERALEIDGESPVAFAGLARARLETGNPQAALDMGLVAAELIHNFPRVHYTIGRALLALGDPQGAAEALELCVQQAPKMAEAHKSLASAYRQLGKSQQAMAAELRSRGTLA